MITTVSLSPAIDKRIEFDAFTVGGTNRVASIAIEGAGKAIDVALTGRALDMEMRCVGLLGADGGPITARLDALGVPHDFLSAPGSVRVNQKLYDRAARETTEINEPVPEAPAALLAAAEDAAVTAAARSEYLVLTGSLPTACPADWYARVIARVRAEAPACRCVLDAEGARFTAGLAARPWLVKPNLHELALAAGRQLSGLADILTAARGLIDQGATWAVVSMGGDGAMAVSAEEAYHADALPVPILTTTGAGDAMVAGLLHGHLADGTLETALRHGIASAAARCGYAGVRYADRAIFDEWLPRVVIRAA